MYPPFDYFEHTRACVIKQRKREAKFEALPDVYKGPLTPQNLSILNASISSLVGDVESNKISPVDILRTYGKTAALAQKRSNCVTELLLPEAEAWAKTDVNLDGPLAGIPISLKDGIHVGGFDATVGYSIRAFKPCPEDGVIVKLLKRAGAVPHVKTALPITMLSFESTTDLWGRCKNPHNPKYSPGGSSGGEAALIALNGSRIGIGSDVAGSVRVPAAWSGIYSLKCSTGRWPKGGVHVSMYGSEGIPAVYSPMTRTLDDLTYFTKAFIGMKPWELDYTCHPLPWKDDAYEKAAEAKSLRIGLMSTDGVCLPSPAIHRAVEETAAALRAAGHTVVPIPVSSFPETATPYDALQIASVLLLADGGAGFSSFFRTGEWNDPGAQQLYFWTNLPRPIKYLYYLYVRYVRGDPMWAGLLRYMHPLKAKEQWQWVYKREVFKATWFEWMNKPEQSFDFILCPANATPALPHGCMHDAVSSCGYTFLWNLLDYTAGVLPVTKVDAVKDASPKDFRPRNGVEQGAYKHYDSVAMKGLPCAVQVVGRRLNEEKMLGYMKVVEDSLRASGVVYEHLDIENLEDINEERKVVPVDAKRIW